MAQPARWVLFSLDPGLESLGVGPEEVDFFAVALVGGAFREVSNWVELFCEEVLFAVLLEVAEPDVCRDGIVDSFEFGVESVAVVVDYAKRFVKISEIKKSEK